MWKLLLAELRYRTGRIIATSLGVALGVALFLALTAFGEGFREAARESLSGIGADILLTRPAGEDEGKAGSQVTRGPRMPFGLSTFKSRDLDAVRRISAVGSATGALLVWDFSGASYKTILGVDGGQTGIGPGSAHQNVVSGRFLASNETGTAIVDKHYAALFKMNPGASAEIGGKIFKVVGIIEAKGSVQAAAANFYIPLADAQKLVNADSGDYNQIYVQLSHASMADETIAKIRDAIGEVSAITEQSIVQVMGGIARVSARFSWLASAGALICGLLLTGLALASSVTERRREIGLQKAVGWTKANVSRYFLSEGFAVSLLGALAGLIVGWFFCLVLSAIPLDLSVLSSSTPTGITLESSAKVSSTLPAHLTLLSILIVLLSAVAGGGIVSWLVARRASDIKPVDALRA